MAQTGIYILALGLSICITGVYGRSPNRIINGQHAWVGEFPHQVSIQKSGQHHCGGSIIDATHILTAAHCLVGPNHEPILGLEVVTGINDKTQRSFDNVFPAARLLYHHAYNLGGRQANDIGIIKLDRPIPFNAHQSPIRLPTSDVPDSTVVKASGWGVNGWNDFVPNLQTPQYLQKIAMRVISYGECELRLSQQNIHVTPNHICVLPLPETPGPSGVCFGDSGGPLTHNGEVIGVTSFGVPCGKGYPDVYTRVYHYLPWIQRALTM